MKTNRNFGKLKSETEIEYGPIPLTVVTHHREEEDVPIYDPETGEPVIDPETGEQKTEHIVRDWDTSEVKIRPTEKDYRQMGFKSVSEAAPSEPAPVGYHYEARGYAEDESRIWRIYETVANPPAPPRTFSKLKCVAALMEAELWGAVKSYIESMGLYDLYLAAQDFREDNEYFVRGKAALMEALSLTEEQVEAILQKCVIG